MKIKILRPVKKSTSSKFFAIGSRIEVNDEYGKRLIEEGKAKDITKDVDMFLQDAIKNGAAELPDAPKPKRKRRTTAKKQTPPAENIEADNSADENE